MNNHNRTERRDGRKSGAFLPLLLCLALVCGIVLQAAPLAQAKEIRAAIVTGVTGTVMVTKAGGSNEYRAFADMSLYQGDHIRTEDGASIVLQIVDREDEVTIGPNTELYISSLLETDDVAKKSKIKLWAGSVWFKVKKLVNADDEFEVETSTAVMGVRGTNFYVETRSGELFAFMASGVLETRPNEGNRSGSGPATIYPSQQILVVPGSDSDLSQNVTPLDIEDFVEQASPDVIRKLLESIQVIREENEAFLDELRDGKKLIDANSHLQLDDSEELERLRANLTNLLANIAKESVKANKLSEQEVKRLIDEANRGARDPIDLNNVKPFDPSIGMNPLVQRQKEEALRKLQEERDRQRQEAAQINARNAELLDRLEKARAAQAEANRKAMEERQREAERMYLSQLSELERQRFELEKRQKEGSPPAVPPVSGGGAPASGNGNSGPGEVVEGQQPDTTPPNRPIIVDPESNTVWNAADSKHMKIKAELGSTIVVESSLGDSTRATGRGDEPVQVDLSGFRDGIHTLTVTARDAGGNISLPSSGVPTITIDTQLELSLVSPISPVSSANLEQTIVVSSERGATVRLVQNGSVLPLIPAEEDGQFTFTITLTPGSVNLFEAKATDAAGNWKQIHIPAISIDAPPPGTGTVLINGGDISTGNPAVSLTFSGMDGYAEMIVSDKGDFSGASWQPIQSTLSSFTFSGSLGTNTVYVKFRNGSGKESAVFSDSIELVPLVYLVPAGLTQTEGSDYLDFEIRMKNFIGSGKSFYGVEIELETPVAYTSPHISDEGIFPSALAVSAVNGNQTDGNGVRTIRYAVTQFDDGTATDREVADGVLVRMKLLTSDYRQTAESGTVRIKKVVVVNKRSEVVASSSNELTMKTGPDLSFPIKGEFPSGY